MCLGKFLCKSRNDYNVNDRFVADNPNTYLIARTGQTQFNVQPLVHSDLALIPLPEVN